jgi:RimJ/RimL family protein N-acetyltransferase
MQVGDSVPRDRSGAEGVYQTRPLGPPDLPALQRLFERAAEYFEIATGAPPGPDEAQRAFVGGPPSKAVSEKQSIGVFDGTDTLVGILDAIPDFPEAQVCTIGLLLIDPAVRGRGIGTTVLTAFERHMAAGGMTRLRAAVVAHHAPGLRFLERAGYREVSRLDGYEAADSRPTVVFLEKAFPPAR